MAEINNPYFEDIRAALQQINLDILYNKKILITGATGLIGGCLVDMLLSSKTCDVYALGRNEERAKKRFSNYWSSPCFHFIQGDITNPLTSDIRFDYIIHAASNASPNFFKEKPVEVMKSNFLGVENLLQYGISHSMQRMLFVSSGEIYGEGDGKIFTETDSGYVDCATPRACYPSSKRAAETLCVAYHAEYGADVVIARPCHTYGPYFTESDNRVYAQFIRNLQSGQDIVMKSTGQQYRSWIYVVDCASALLTILTKGGNGEAYNVADEHSNFTIRQLAETMAQAAGKNVIFDIPDTQGQGNSTPITQALFSTNKLKSLGWQAQTPIQEGISHTLKTCQEY